MLLANGLAYGQNINTFSVWNGSQHSGYVGEIGTYATAGQTFRFNDGDDTSIESLTFYIGDYQGDDNVEFSLYIYRWDNSSLLITGSSLFTSAKLETSGNNTTTWPPSPFQTFTVNVGGLDLETDTDYVWFISASNYFDGVKGTAYFGFTTNSYSDGAFFSNSNGSDFLVLSSDAWDPLLSYDVAFIMNLSAAVPPTISSTALASDNSYVDITISEGVYNTNGGSGALETSDFTITFAQNIGNASAAAISSLTNTSGGALSGGESIIRVNLSITGTPSGVETVTVTPLDGNSIFDLGGVAMEVSQTTGAITLNDQLSPTITFSPSDGATGVDVSTNITLTFSEAVRNTDNSELTDSNVDGLITLKQTNASGENEAFNASINIGKTVISIDPSAYLDYEQVYYVAIGASVEDANNNAVSAASGSATTEDEPGGTLTPSGGGDISDGLTTTEGGGTAAFTAALDTQPTGDVTIGLSSSDETEGTVSPSSLTFTNANWSTTQTVTVTGVDDYADDGDITYSIVTAVAVSSDFRYSGLNPVDVSVTNTDDDAAGITFSATSGLTTTEAGGTASFTAVLNSQPTGDAAFDLTSYDLTEGTVYPASLTFTSADWSTAQTVTLTGVDDIDDDGDIAYSVITGAVTSTDSDYNGVNPSDISLTNLDNDAGTITLSTTSGLTTTEAGGTATFTVVLSTEPSADVTIGLSSSDETEGAVSPTSVTFTSANYSTAQTVTITGVDDDLDDGDINYSIVTGTSSSSDDNYNGVNLSDVSVTNTDNDDSGISSVANLGDADALTTTEDGGIATFTIVLGSASTADVTIGLSSSDETEGTVSPTSVTFTSSNWSTAQTVTISGVDDTVDDGDVAYTIVTAAATSSDANYSGLNASDIAVTNRDNDSGAINVSPTSGLVTTEAGGTDDFTIVLGSQPSADVTIALSSSDETEGTVSPSSLTFTSANWNVSQTVTVTGVDDAIGGTSDGDVNYTIVTAAAVSTDAGYSAVNPDDVTVTNLDDESIGITVNPLSEESNTTSEAGASDIFTVVLRSQPSADVTIALSTSDATEGTVSPSSLTFTSSNYSTAQTVTVTGVDDYVADGDVIYSIVTAGASSTDSDYNGLDASDPSFINLNDDTRGIILSTTTGLITTEAGGTATFTIVLNSEPTADVTIPLSTSDATEGTLSPTSVTLTSSNWSTAQTVTLTGVNDDIDDGDIAYTILTGLATSDDVVYDNIDPDDVSATNTDDDTAGITVTTTADTVTTENGDTATFTVVLDTEPVADVSIFLWSSIKKEGEPSPTSVTFSSSNWNTSQTVIVTGICDHEADGDTVYAIITDAAVSADDNYMNLDPVNVSLLSKDVVVSVNPSRLDFGDVDRGDSSTLSFYVINTSPDTLTINDITMEEAWFVSLEEPFSMSQDSFRIAPYDSAQVAVTFLPEMAAAYRTIIAIEHDFPKDIPSLLLIGDGVKPTVVASADSLDFGEIRVGTNYRQDFFVSNAGNAMLTIDSLVSSHSAFVVETDRSFFGMSSAGQEQHTAKPRKLRPSRTIGDERIIEAMGSNPVRRGVNSGLQLLGGDTLTVTVTFVPEDSVQLTESLSIFSDDPDAPLTTITLTGDAFIADTTGPSITLSSRIDPTEPVSSGASFPVTFIVSDDNAIRSVTLFYMIEDTTIGLTFLGADMSSDSEGEFEAVIPEDAVTLKGIAYFALAIDEAGNMNIGDTTYIPSKFSDGDITTASVRTSAFPGGLPKNKWRLISVPGELNDQKVKSVFGDELQGKPSETTWKMAEYTGTDWDDPSRVRLGNGYWIYQRVKGDVVLSPGSGVSAGLEGFTVALNPGWNLFGHPYSFPMTVTPDPQLFYGPIDYGADGEGWSEVVTELVPWGAYALYNRTNDLLTVDLLPLASEPLLQEDEGAVTLNRSVSEALDASTKGNWRLQLKVRGKTYSDVANYIGRHSEASEERDFFDNPEPLYIENYVSLVVNRPRWENNRSQFSSDIRSLEETDGIWDLHLRVKGEDGPITLSPDISGAFPEDQEIVLLDMTTREVYNLVSTDRIGISEYSEEFPYKVKVIAGSSAFVQMSIASILETLPEAFALSPNYPNPFNPTTHIEYALPSPEQVSIQIYNLLGQRVASLVNEWQDAGYHQTAWHGKDQRGRLVGSGVYFYRIRAGKFTESRKMILLR